MDRHVKSILFTLYQINHSMLKICESLNTLKSKLGYNIPQEFQFKS